MKLYHDYYSTLLPVWKRAEASLDGKPFIVKHLEKHNAESTMRYRRRKRLSSYHNIPDSILQRWLQIQGKGKISVEGAAELKPIMENIDRKGNDTVDLVQEVSRHLYVYGSVWMLVDLPEWNAPENATEQDRKDAGVYPYVSLYTQPNIINWKFDRFDNLLWLICDTGDTHTIDGKEHKVYALYQRGLCRKFVMGEAKTVEDATVIEEILLIYNKQPVMPWMVDGVLHYLSAPDCWKGVMNAIVDTAIEAYNRTSANGSAYDYTDFQFLTAQEGTDIDELGNTVIVFYPEGAQQPQWIAPVAANFEQTRKEIDRLITAMYEMAGVKNRAVSSDTAKSGTALRLEDAQAENKVYLIATKTEQVIKKAWEMLALMNGTPDAEIAISFPDSYDTQALQTELENLEAYYKLKNNAFYLTKFAEFIRRVIPDKDTQDKCISEAETKTGLRLDSVLNEGVINFAINSGVMSLVGLAKEINPELSDKSDEEINKWIKGNAEFAKTVVDKYNLTEAA